MWGVQWESKDDDREIARRVINLLEDRRMLWKDFRYEIEEHCVSSANQVRRDLGDLINNPAIGTSLTPQLKALQQLFRSFVDEVGPHEEDQRWHRYSGGGTDPLSMALGRLRALVGLEVGRLSSQYGLDISDDLATIVPDEDGWFFDRFQ